MEPGALQTVVQPPFAWYREFAPCEALRADVYAFFSFVPGSALAVPPRPLLRQTAFRRAMLCAPQFADGQVSIRFELGQVCDDEGRWRADSNAFGEMLIGPMSGVGRTHGVELSETVGAYFRPGSTAFFDVSSCELTDAAVEVGDISGARSFQLSSELADLNEAARVNRLESALLARLRNGRHRRVALDVRGVAASVLRTGGESTSTTWLAPRASRANILRGSSVSSSVSDRSCTAGLRAFNWCWRTPALEPGSSGPASPSTRASLTSLT